MLLIVLSVSSPAKAQQDGQPVADADSYSIEVGIDKDGLVDLNAKSALIRDVLSALAVKSGRNIIFDADIKGVVNASLKGVPFNAALHDILKIKGYGFNVTEYGYVVTGPYGEADSKEQEMDVMQYSLMYIKPTERLMDSLKKLLSPSGTVAYMADSSVLLIKDTPSGLKRAVSVLGALDKRPHQVMIEAKLVETGASTGRELGVSWGASYKRVSADVMGGLGTSEGGVSVNLQPAQPSNADESGATQSGALLGFGLVSDKLALDLKITALEQAGRLKVLSSPRILVMDNRKAVITTGTELLVNSYRAATVIKTSSPEPESVLEGYPETLGIRQTKPETFDARISLSVEPRVIDDHSLSLEIETTREDFDFSMEFDGYPPKRSKTAKTELMLKNGQTAAIGGILTDVSLSSSQSVPWMSKIPFIGWLFRHNRSQSEQTELLIFITPTIQEED